LPVKALDAHGDGAELVNASAARDFGWLAADYFGRAGLHGAFRC
jgi:hypothetical protein